MLTFITIYDESRHVLSALVHDVSAIPRVGEHIVESTSERKSYEGVVMKVIHNLGGSGQGVYIFVLMSEEALKDLGDKGIKCWLSDDLPSLISRTMRSILTDKPKRSI